jgi:hypothetical protein
MELRGRFCISATLHLGEFSVGIHSIRGWMGGEQVSPFGIGKIRLPFPEIEPRLLGYSVT